MGMGRETKGGNVKTFKEVSEDPVFAGIVGDTVQRLSGRDDFGIIVIIVSNEGQSMINSLPSREFLCQVLQDALDKATSTNPDAHLTAAKAS